MHIQEQEERDYQMGCGSELQNAFAMSAMEFDNGWEPIQKAIDAGKIVVAYVGTAYCHRTDAILGARYGQWTAIDDRRGADLLACRLNRELCENGFDDGSFDVFPPASRVPVGYKPLSNEDVPF